MPGTYEYTGMRAVRRPTRADVEAAALRIAPSLQPTPVAEADGLVLKLETVQPTGSFKVRGALAALTTLERGEHVVTASAGNHGLAVAWAAKLLGLEATVVVPVNAARAKVDALRRFPATLVEHGASFDDAERHALSLGGRYVSAYNDTEVIAGAGTIGLELPDAETLVVPIGGGGLCSGLALATGARVIGVVPAAFPAMRASLAAGAVVAIEGGATVADGLHGNIEPGSVTFEIVRDLVYDVVAVDEPAILEAMRFLEAEHGLVVEGAGAAAVAAIRTGAAEAHGRTVAIVSGRNV